MWSAHSLGLVSSSFLGRKNSKPKPLATTHPNNSYERDLLLAQLGLGLWTWSTNWTLDMWYPNCTPDMLSAHSKGICDLLIAHQKCDLLTVWGWSAALFFCRISPKPKPLGTHHPKNSYRRYLLIAQRTCDLLTVWGWWASLFLQN
jgi:hypothetical protein